RHRPEPSKARHAGSGSPADTGLRGRHPSPTPLAAPSLHRPDNPQTYFFHGIGASPSLPGILGKILHRTDSGHSPWQREPLFVPPLALATPLAHSSGRSSTSPTTGNPLSCKYGPLSAVRAEGYTQFLGSIRPANRVERTRTNMSVGQCHEADERSAFRNPAAAHGRGHRNPGRPCERGAGQGGPRRTRVGRDAQRPAAPLRALLPGPSRLPGHAAADRLR